MTYPHQFVAVYLSALNPRPGAQGLLKDGSLVSSAAFIVMVKLSGEILVSIAAYSLA